MSQGVLNNFFTRNLPLFEPRAQAFLRDLKPEQLRSEKFRALFSVQEMLRISYRLENLVVAVRGAAEVHVSFQHFSRFKRQMNRYEKVARAARHLWLYGVPDTPLQPMVNTTLVDTSATQLVDYWFIVISGPGVSATLLAEETTHLDETSAPRQYQGFYTYEPMTAFQLISLLHQTFPGSVPSPLTQTG